MLAGASPSRVANIFPGDAELRRRAALDRCAFEYRLLERGVTLQIARTTLNVVTRRVQIGRELGHVQRSGEIPEIDMSGASRRCRSARDCSGGVSIEPLAVALPPYAFARPSNEIRRPRTSPLAVTLSAR